MADNEKIVQKVIGRLTELRLELGAEERVVLDQVIMGDTAEVSGHAMKFDAPGRIALEDDRYKIVQ